MEEKKLLTNRLNRISGQINGLKKMVDSDTYCNELLIQISAVENSLKSLANHILENHLYTCISRDLTNGNKESMTEIVELFKKFNK